MLPKAITKTEQILGELLNNPMFKRNQQLIPEGNNKLIAAIENGLFKTNQTDTFIKRSDPRYIETEILHRKYLGNNTNYSIRKALKNIVIDVDELSLLLIGVDSYLFTIQDFLDELNKMNFKGKIHFHIVDPLLDELNYELYGIAAGIGNVGNITLVHSTIEDLKPANWLQLDNASGWRLAFANFSLHYIDESKRNEVLKSVRKWCDQMILIERDLQLINLPLHRAIFSVYEHFIPIYERIQNSGANQAERNLLYSWFNMIVKDSLNDQKTVVCTHMCESIHSWVSRMRSAGFQIPQNEVQLKYLEIPLEGISYFPFGVLEESKLYKGFLGIIISSKSKFIEQKWKTSNVKYQIRM